MFFITITTNEFTIEIATCYASGAAAYCEIKHGVAFVGVGLHQVGEECHWFLCGVVTSVVLSVFKNVRFELFTVREVEAASEAAINLDKIREG